MTLDAAVSLHSNLVCGCNSISDAEFRETKMISFEQNRSYSPTGYGCVKKIRSKVTLTLPRMKTKGL